MEGLSPDLEKQQAKWLHELAELEKKDPEEFNKVMTMLEEASKAAGECLNRSVALDASPNRHVPSGMPSAAPSQPRSEALRETIMKQTQAARPGKYLAVHTVKQWSSKSRAPF
jgi:hypothetical protein